MRSSPMFATVSRLARNACRSPAACARSASGSKARVEVAQQQRRRRGMGDQRLHQGVAARRRADLEAVVTVRAQDVHFLPGEPRREHELVQGVALRRAAPHRHQRGDQALAVAAHVQGGAGGVLHEERVQVGGRAVERGNRDRILGEHTEPEVLEDRHDVREHELLAQVELHRRSHAARRPPSGCTTSRLESAPARSASRWRTSFTAAGISVVALYESGSARA